MCPAYDLSSQARALLTPPKPFKTGLGGKVIPTIDQGLPGLELALKEPDSMAKAGVRVQWGQQELVF